MHGAERRPETTSSNYGGQLSSNSVTNFAHSTHWDPSYDMTATVKDEVSRCTEITINI